MLEGTQKLFPKDYESLKSAMLEAAENGNLPLTLQLTSPTKFNFQNFQDLFMDFEYDTGLIMTGTFFICNDCGELHVMIEVDYPDEDEYEEPHYLQ